ncbi:MAG: phenylalanine--tRNA ligase subunit alpha [Candidatus Aminicenantes bacterium]|nr:phenylalanine--tRNA ligase subunit alpha [Candidatus Aminicenantes bacterium]
MANLKERIDAVRKEFDEAARRAADAKSLEELRTAYLGRKRGHVTLLFEDLKSVPAEEKREAGRLVNELKQSVTVRLDAIEGQLSSVPPAVSAAGTDLTLPGRKRYVGRPHPLTLFEEEIERIFLGMGFSIEEGPEIETDYYNFEALNFPPHHPARDKWDTLFIKGDLLLRTHTSPVQVRVMERSKPPIRIICPGRVFRRETPDPTHLPMFMQVEGLVIDEGVTFAHLKGTLEYFLRALFGEKIKVRFRPSFFPFTEPSAEVDIECLVCSGKDPACRVCGGTGWKEILGSGMVDPQVLKNVNIDPEKYSGWAFGLGIDRTAMFAYGIPEMRYFYENDLRFLRQFGTK